MKRNALYLVAISILILFFPSWVMADPLAAGRYHSCAIKTDGTLWCAGWNYGQLGLGTADCAGKKCEFTQEFRGDTDWAALSAGAYFTLALKTGGTLWATGTNNNCQLGLGGRSGKICEFNQIGTDSDWAMVSGGGYHALAVKNDGRLYGWGYSTFGQVGDGTTAIKCNPVEIQNGQVCTDAADPTTCVEVPLPDIVYCSAGGYHSLAIDTTGDVWAWGWNRDGQLGIDNESIPSHVTFVRKPTRVVYAAVSLPLVSASNVAAGWYHSTAVKTDGTLWTWGDNYSWCQLGLGQIDRADKRTPQQVGADVDWIRVRAGFFHNLAQKANGTLWGWGFGRWGQVGENDCLAYRVCSPEIIDQGQQCTDTSDSSTCSDVVLPEMKVFASGAYHSIAVEGTANTIWRWGHNGYGQLGLGVADCIGYKCMPTQEDPPSANWDP
jgi:alpha-tubulin suppressor-like RCC1 family protein